MCANLLRHDRNLCDSMDCNTPGSTAHGILWARILEWVAMSFSRGSSLPRDETRCLLYPLHQQAGSLPLVPPRNPIFLNPTLFKNYEVTIFLQSYNVYKCYFILSISHVFLLHFFWLKRGDMFYVPVYSFHFYI